MTQHGCVYKTAVQIGLEATIESDNQKTEPETTLKHGLGGQERSLLLLQTQMSLEVKIADNKPPKVGLQRGRGGWGMETAMI